MQLQIVPALISELERIGKESVVCTEIGKLLRIRQRVRQTNCLRTRIRNIPHMPNEIFVGIPFLYELQRILGVVNSPAFEVICELLQASCSREASLTSAIQSAEDVYRAEPENKNTNKLTSAKTRKSLRRSGQAGD